MTLPVDARSSFADAEWSPLQEALLRGLNHALSNRLASLGACTMLLEGGETMDERLQRMLASDVERLGELLAAYRSLTPPAEVRREPMRLTDALSRAATLLAQHHESRDLVLAAVEEAADADPVHLLSHDAVRASVLLLLAVARGAPGSPALRVTVEGADGWVHVSASRDGAEPSAAATCAEFVLLERFATVEGGRVSAGSTAADPTLTLTLPGLARSRATELRR